jgi:hypothetical protein
VIGDLTLDIRGLECRMRKPARMNHGCRPWLQTQPRFHLLNRVFLQCKIEHAYF